MTSEEQGVLNKQDSVSPAEDAVFLEMAKAGVLYGHKKSRKNPRFGEFIFTTRNGVEIMDITKTQEYIVRVAKFLADSKKEGKKILVVGTQKAAREAVQKLAKELSGLFVVNKWIGGLITNCKEISGRIEYFRKRKHDEEHKKFENYTKKERLMIHREIEKMSERFFGIEEYDSEPDVMFVIDSSPKGHITALREAKARGIAVVGIIDNDDDPQEFDYFVPANDHAKSSIDWVVDSIISNMK